MEAWGEREGDEFTEELTMASVPLEKTYASIERSVEMALSAGETSGKVESES